MPQETQSALYSHLNQVYSAFSADKQLPTQLIAAVDNLKISENKDFIAQIEHQRIEHFRQLIECYRPCYELAKKEISLIHEIQSQNELASQQSHLSVMAQYEVAKSDMEQLAWKSKILSALVDLLDPPSAPVFSQLYLSWMERLVQLGDCPHPIVNQSLEEAVATLHENTRLRVKESMASPNPSIDPYLPKALSLLRSITNNLVPWKEIVDSLIIQRSQVVQHGFGVQSNYHFGHGNNVDQIADLLSHLHQLLCSEQELLDTLFDVESSLFPVTEQEKIGMLDQQFQSICRVIKKRFEILVSSVGRTPTFVDNSDDEPSLVTLYRLANVVQFYQVLIERVFYRVQSRRSSFVNEHQLSAQVSSNIIARKPILLVFLEDLYSAASRQLKTEISQYGSFLVNLKADSLNTPPRFFANYVSVLGSLLVASTKTLQIPASPLSNTSFKLQPSSRVDVEANDMLELFQLVMEPFYQTFSRLQTTKPSFINCALILNCYTLLKDTFEPQKQQIVSVVEHIEQQYQYSVLNLVENLCDYILSQYDLLLAYKYSISQSEAQLFDKSQFQKAAMKFSTEVMNFPPLIAEKLQAVQKVELSSLLFQLVAQELSKRFSHFQYCLKQLGISLDILSSDQVDIALGVKKQ